MPYCQEYQSESIARKAPRVLPGKRAGVSTNALVRSVDTLPEYSDPPVIAMRI